MKVTSLFLKFDVARLARHIVSPNKQMHQRVHKGLWPLAFGVGKSNGS